EIRGPATGPDPGRLATTGVVVVQTTSDLLLVVGLLPQRQLRHAQHASTAEKSKRAKTHMHPRCGRRCRFAKRATNPSNSCPTAGAQKPVFGRSRDQFDRSRNPCSNPQFGEKALSAQTPRTRLTSRRSPVRARHRPLTKDQLRSPFVF